MPRFSLFCFLTPTWTFGLVFLARRSDLPMKGHRRRAATSMRWD